MTELGRTAGRTPSSTSHAAGAPRIYYLDPLAASSRPCWAGWLDHAAGLGFDHVLIPPPFRPAQDGNRLAPADLQRLHPALAWADGLTALAEPARAAGLRLLIDVDLHQLAAGSAPADPVLFAAPGRDGVLDPRQDIASGHAARLRQDAPAEQIAGFWAEHLLAWQEAGISGLRLLGLDPLGWAAPSVVAGLRQRLPDLQLIGWTPGLPHAALGALRAAGLDFVCSSLPWWDFRSEWLWDELRRLREVAPVIVPAEAPFGARTAGGPGAARRAIGLAATLGAGWLMPMGMEAALPRPLNTRSAMRLQPDAFAGTDDAAALAGEIAALNAARASLPGLQESGGLRLLSAGAGPVIAMLRGAGAGDVSGAAEPASLVLVNTVPNRAQTVDMGTLLARIGGAYDSLRPVLAPDTTALLPVAGLVLAPGETRLYRAEPGAAARPAAPLQRQSGLAAAQAPRIGIENITPTVDGGQFPIKRLAGEWIGVEADVICDGHDQLAVALHWRETGEASWQEARMRPLGNDRWGGGFPLSHLGTYEFTIQAWRDAFATYRDELDKKFRAGVEIGLELREGVALVEQAAARPAGQALQPVLTQLRAANADGQRDILLSDTTAGLMAAADDRPFAVRVEPCPRVESERIAARFASWYEVFPRSLSDDPQRHGTFRDVIRHLPRIQAMGFDVLYFPPIHPIGRTNRKGVNNALKAGPDDPGSPYAIGAPEGGHEAIHPELGSFEDFQALREAAAQHGLELALDFAVQCSPDHPWLQQHPGWFAHRPDGSIRYAENPPKKYEDIVNVDFYAPGAIPDLWLALCEAVLYWAGQGVRLFRVDNPHTKPLPFWQWLIAEVRARYPDSIFLAEAFTRPKVMYRLGKIGFSQSYTYFTWRNGKQELQEYLTELATTAPKDFFRPHLFVNTPDINPGFLHHSGRAGFLIRAALAATLSGLWGVYNGFELCEATPVKPGKEEYLDSEKYQLRAWDWNRPGNIVPEITRLNAIRRGNPALQTHLGVEFHTAHNDAVIYYEKATPDRSNVVLVAVNLDPYNAQDADFELPLWNWDLPDHAALEAEDLVNGDRFTWHGKQQHLHLPTHQPYAIWRVRPAE